MSTPSNPLAAYFSTLQEIFQEQARWRREKAREYPDDDVRNQAAANIFDRLAATAEKVPPDVLAAFVELVGDEFRELEALQEMLRQVGFVSTYDTAVDFVRALIAKRKAGG
jgi:FMN phosphatase YigB (HAD superfamily)